MLDNKESVECSVMICTYNPDFMKLKRTLNSILLQRGCTYKIVITDDGSEENYFQEIEEYFLRHNFTAYEFVQSEHNMGTVQNVFRGLKACEGEYVKPISPGDCLHGYYVLREWIDFMDSHKECILSYSNPVYYLMDDEKLKILSLERHPQSQKIGVRECFFWGDYINGAATFLRTKQWQRYLNEIVGKVVYAEDLTYKIMVFCNETLLPYTKNNILYEYGSGVSTGTSDVWHKRLMRDEYALDRVLNNYNNVAGRESVKDYLLLRKEKNLLGKIKRNIMYPSKILFKIKRKLFPCKTPREIDRGFVEMILK